MQKFTEDLSYVNLLNAASDARDSLLRLAYVACFAVSSYTSTINRTMKPFNPVLGETFELERDGFRVLSEQVSHHPPISSIHCEHENFRFWASTEVKSSFKGTYLQIMPTGKHHVYLTKHNEEFTWDKAITNVNNIIIGQINLEHIGEIHVINEKTGEKATAVFKKRGWFDKATSEVNGMVCDSNGIERYTLTGKWDDSMYIINSRTQEQTLAYSIHPLPEAWEHNYYFTDFALQLNLPAELFTGLLPTDSRFRPDQRALENGDIKLATDEKHRVEEKQRKARKDREVQGIEYRPRWFSLENGEWVYHGGFWEGKEGGMYTNIPDIF